MNGKSKRGFWFPFAVLSHHKSMSPKYESFEREFGKKNGLFLLKKKWNMEYSLLDEHNRPKPPRISSNQTSLLKIDRELFSLVNMEQRAFSKLPLIPY